MRIWKQENRRPCAVGGCNEPREKNAWLCLDHRGALAARIDNLKEEKMDLLLYQARGWTTTTGKLPFFEIVVRCRGTRPID